MELAGINEGLQSALPPGTGHRLVISFSDYEGWTSANLDVHRVSGTPSLKHPHIWASSIHYLEGWTQALHSPQQPCWFLRIHTKAHQSCNGDWSQNLNEIADIGAFLGKTLLTRDWIWPVFIGTRDPDVMARDLLGPCSQAEVHCAVMSRSLHGADVGGLEMLLVRKAGDPAEEAFVTDFNRAFFQGKVPIYSADGTILSKHSAIGKPGGGTRHLVNELTRLRLV